MKHKGKGLQPTFNDSAIPSWLSHGEDIVFLQIKAGILVYKEDNISGTEGRPALTQMTSLC